MDLSTHSSVDLPHCPRGHEAESSLPACCQEQALSKSPWCGILP
jgi:hypothetical protein